MKKIFAGLILALGILVVLIGIGAGLFLALTPETPAQPTQISQDATPVVPPTAVPTIAPTNTPTIAPTNTPTNTATTAPTNKPTNTAVPPTKTPVPPTNTPTQQSTVVSTPPPTVVANTRTPTPTEIPSTGGKLQDGGFIVENDETGPQNSPDQASPGISRKTLGLIVIAVSVVFGIVLIIFALGLMGRLPTIRFKKAPAVGYAAQKPAAQVHAPIATPQPTAAPAQPTALPPTAAPAQPTALPPTATPAPTAAEPDALSKLLDTPVAAPQPTAAPAPVQPPPPTQRLKRATPQIPLKGPTPDQN